MKFNHLTRIRFLSFCIFAFAALLVGRLYFLQVMESEMYSSKADRQYQSTSKNVFDRGSIFFQNKDGSLVSAATLRSGFIVAINPEILKDPESVWQKVNEIMPIDHDEFISKATKTKDPYEEIAVHIDTDIGKKIGDLKIPGLQVYKDRWRFYPGGNTASHVIGILGFKGDEYAGRYGLERQFESFLNRSDGAYVNFFAQIFSDIKSVTQDDGSLEADIITTIEPTVQSHLQTVIEDTTKKWGSDSTGAIVMNPMTGEIYAMEVYPSFDPNNSSEEKNAAIFSNPLVENVYEMGSVIKTLTLASGIDAGVVNANTTYYDKGYLMINNKKVSNFDGKERGVVSMQDMLSQSLNVGAAYVQNKLGNAQFSKYMYGFSLGNKTGIELPNEAKNLVSSLDSKIDIDLASASFGQSLALTPISTISAISVIANGGTVIKPHLVKSIKYKVGVSKDTEIGLGQRVIKRETSEEVSRMMVYSMDNVLANGTLKLPRHSVAVKTGTAQIAKPGGGGYYEDRVLHSFVGFFPAYNPKFIIFMYTLNPKGVRFGSETLTSPFVDMVKFLINYYEVPPDR
jgi:stage V sporulation protein D (sporulation-specific penicillin-binding protein)